MESKPDKETLIDYLYGMVDRFPPGFSRNCINAYKALIDEFPEIILYKEFALIYAPGKTPWQIAGEVLKPRRRKRERGLDKENRTLLIVHYLLHKPEVLIEKWGMNIRKRTLCAYLRIANLLRTQGTSLDQHFSHLPEKERICIAESLGCLYETGVMFRTELYKKYTDKAKTIKKMPELGEYYDDAQKLITSPRGGKQVIRQTIARDIREFSTYLIDENARSKASKEFYDVKRFRYMAKMVTEIDKFFDRKPKKIDNPRAGRERPNDAFSMDHYLDVLMSQPRRNYGVVLLTLPPLDCAGTVITQ